MDEEHIKQAIEIFCKDMCACCIASNLIQLIQIYPGKEDFIIKELGNRPDVLEEFRLQLKKS